MRGRSGYLHSPINARLILYLLSINYIACAGMRGLVYESVGKYSCQIDPCLPSEQSIIDDYHTHDFTQLLHFTQAPLPFL